MVPFDEHTTLNTGTVPLFWRPAMTCARCSSDATVCLTGLLTYYYYYYYDYYYYYYYYHYYYDYYK